MNSKLATITALVIATLVAIVGMFPGARDAALSIFRGKSDLPDWMSWWGLNPQAAGSTEGDATTKAGGGAHGAGRNGQSPDQGPRPVVGDRRAEGLLAKSIARIERCPSIAAKTHQVINLYGKRLVGTGEYLEQKDGQKRLFRLELKVQMGEDARTLLEVCDGSYFWRCEWYKGKCIAEKTDLARAVRAWEGRRDLGALGDMGSWPRLGGLSRLLRELRNWFQFVAADETKLADQTPVIRLHGVWRPERLATLAPGPPGRVTSGTIGLKDLPEHLPDSVMLFLDRDDLFPFRIEYRRQKLPSLPVHAAGEEFAIVTMDFYLVNLNQPIDADRFAFSPRNLNYSDQTDRFLERLGLKRE